MTSNNKPLIEHGWLRACLYILFSLALILVVNTILSKVVIKFHLSFTTGSDLPLTSVFLSYIISTTVLVGMAFLFRKLIDRQSIISMGFRWKGFGRHAASGFFLGILLLCIGVLILVLLQFLFFTTAVFNFTGLLLSFLFFVLVAFTEEIAFRGYILNNLLQSTNKWIALLVSAMLFSVFHGANANISTIAFLNILVAGILLGLNYIFTRNIWFAIFFHFSWNFFQGPIFGFEVSGIEIPGLFQQTLKGPDLLTGGDFGFEGSLISFLLNALACFFLASYYAGYRKRSAPEFKN